MSNAANEDKELMEEARTRLMKTAEGILNGSIGIIEGCRMMNEFIAFAELNIDEDDRVTFQSVESRTDHLPVGEVRKLWNEEALKKKDEEIKKIEIMFTGIVKDSCSFILNKYTSER